MKSDSNGWRGAAARVRALGRALALGWLAAALLGCGDAGADRNKAQLRLVNASAGYDRLDLRVDSQVRQAAVTYGASAGYAEVDPNPGNMSIHAAGSATALLSLRPALAKGRHYTWLAFGNAGALRQLLLDDELGAPEAGRVTLRIVNAAPDSGTLDLYLTGSNETLAASVPVQTALEYGSAGATVSVASGSWRLRVAAAGSKTDLRLDVGTLALASRQVVTLVLTPGRGGVLVNALVLAQQGAIARQDGTAARVRVVAGVAAGGTVSAAAGGTPLISAGSPAVGAYQLVTAGDVTPTLAVNGAPLAASARTLTAGADYTLLVHGAPAAPRADWIEDDNRLPTVAGSARVRLVNGVSGLTVPLAMTVDFLPLSDQVAAGAASAYASANASLAARVAVTASGAALPLFVVTDQRLDAAAVYSVFVVGAHDAATGIVRKDR